MRRGQLSFHFRKRVEASLVLKGKRHYRLECGHVIPEPPEWARQAKRYTCLKCYRLFSS